MLTKSSLKPTLDLDPNQFQAIDPDTAIDIFRSSLPESDQQILSELLVSAGHFRTALEECGQPLPDHVILLALLFEEHKELLRLRQHLASN